MTAPTKARRNPPFRAEHIGSLLRPRALKDAFKAHSAGEIGDEAFETAKRAAIRDVVAMQEGLGLEMVTDGEFRRKSYWGHWVDAIDGFDVAPSLFTFHDESGAEQEFIAADCVGPLRKAAPISTEEFAFLRTAAKTAEPKITMPSPSTLHFWRLSKTIEGSGYATDEAFFDDLCAIFRQEIADLAALGCRYVQLDEVPLIMLGSPAVCERVRALGGDPDRLLDLYIEAMNAAVRGRGDTVAAMHMCRGNFRGKWLSEGGYDLISERVFQNVEVDAFMLEYDTGRAGGFEPLRHVPDDKSVVLGIVSSKVPEIEAAGELKRRIDEAARYIDRERLSLSPQCGFASTVAGNPVREEDEKAKLEAIVRVAKDVWA
ncbi:MAG: 5-methyltetrahydropteroyltriglutamate--homocysteine S-methyltransferase [Rhodospirillaceae bacterium]|nr:5-methyltetrahydropteroyltriglutamate--homocysteine S-methyltransferase [Rhodospirillaceae bacterium]MYJ70869.1 5-methyltetrahydropteroyltriglutamate--homocysteine S-methyltransferase [Rhodospirillaceae bacterium]